MNGTTRGPGVIDDLDASVVAGDPDAPTGAGSQAGPGPGAGTGQGTDDALEAAAARLYLALGRLARIIRRAGEGDLGPGTFSALATLAQHGPMRLGDLAAREGVAPPTLTRIVAALEESGLVVRETDPDDRRAVRVAATPEGAALTAGVRSARSAALRDRMLALTPGDRAALLAAVPVLEALAADEG